MTGAAGGIGGAVARAYGEAGATVFGVDRAADGDGWHLADLTDAAAVEEAVRECVRRHGRLDVAFNGAGGSGRRFGDGPVHECTPDGWQRTLELNLTTIFLSCKFTVPELRKTRGAVVNLSSVHALVGAGEGFETHAYAAAKGAVASLTRAMAVTYAPDGVRCNAIAPGLVRTPMSARAQADERIRDRLPELQPLTRDLLEPDDVAAAALYLATAANVTGVVLPVDGGWTAR